MTDRRSLLKALAASAVAGTAGLSLGCTPKYAAERLSLATPPQVVGPFHPFGKTLESCYPADLDNDLATVAGQRPAEGLRMYLMGRITDGGAAVAGATIQVWQTCHRGRYAHPDDEYGSRIPRDVGFAYYGTCVTDAAGEYLFRTVMPRRYPAGYPGEPEWWRPPHVHFRVVLRDERRLTTQLYFRDDLDMDNAWNHIAAQEIDHLLGGVPEARRSELLSVLCAASDHPDLSRMRGKILPRGSTEGDDGPHGPARAGRFDMRIDPPGPGQVLYPEVPAFHPRATGKTTCTDT
jgi:protocatechuate 3,4-dioxygenase beta subunit